MEAQYADRTETWNYSEASGGKKEYHCYGTERTSGCIRVHSAQRYHSAG